MPNTFKVLGQSAPAANTNTTIYTVPASTQAVISTINICNQDTLNRAFSVAVVPSGNTIATQHYVSFRTPIANLDSIAISMGITLSSNDSLIVYSESTANISYSIFGSEIS